MGDLKKYNSDRLVFALLGGAVLVRPEEYADKFSNEWLKEQHGISDEQYFYTVHGSVFKDGHCVFGRGAEYAPINMNELPEKTLMSVVSIACDFLGTDTVRIWNGAVPGKVGDIWSPMEDLGDFKKPGTI